MYTNKQVVCQFESLMQLKYNENKNILFGRIPHNSNPVQPFKNLQYPLLDTISHKAE